MTRSLPAPAATWPAALCELTFGGRVPEIAGAAYRAVEPHARTAEILSRAGRTIVIGDRPVRLEPGAHVVIVGGGKAGPGMARAVCDALANVPIRGFIATKTRDRGPAETCPGMTFAITGHPLPNAASLAAGRTIAELVTNLGPKDLVLCPLSGGSSAGICLPVRGLDLEEVRATTEAMLRSGAAIGPLNAVRKHLERLKGGGLALAAQPAEVVGLIFSDVIDDALATIGSGPTSPDPSTYADALEAIAENRCHDTVPPSVLEHLRAGAAGQRPETPTAEHPGFARVTNVLVASNRDARRGALTAAATAGMRAEDLGACLSGTAVDAGHRLGRHARQMCGFRLGAPRCMVAGGETTVAVRGTGRGGRNLEVALAAAIELDGLADAAVVTLATDGEDGPTDAAGALATGSTVTRARALGLDPFDHLARNDSYAFFAALDDLVRTGPTGTNVCDLALVVVGGR